MIYSELQTAIADYTHRSDLVAKIPSLIAQAEAKLFRELNIKALNIILAGTTTGEYITLPTDFGQVNRVTITFSSREYNLDYASQPFNYVSPFPKYYALENNKLRIFGAATGQAYTLYYTPLIAALSATNTSNWILANAQDLYIYASALEVAMYTKNKDDMAVLPPLIDSLLDGVKRFAERKGQPTTSSLQIKPRGILWA